MDKGVLLLAANFFLDASTTNRSKFFILMKTGK